MIYALEEPVAGSTSFGLACTNVPPSTAGFLIIGTRDFPAGLPVLGCTLWIDLLAAHVLVAIASDASGATSLTVPIPHGSSGAVLYTQTLWLNTPACPGAGPVSATDALAVTIQ